MEIDFAVHVGVTAYRLNKKLPFCSVHFQSPCFVHTVMSNTLILYLCYLYKCIMCHVLCSGFLKFGLVGILSFWDVNRSNILVDFIKKLPFYSVHFQSPCFVHTVMSNTLILYLCYLYRPKCIMCHVLCSGFLKFGSAGIVSF